MGEHPVHLKINRRQIKCMGCDKNFSLDRARKKVERESQKIKEKNQKEKTDSAMIHSKYALLKMSKS